MAVLTRLAEQRHAHGDGTLRTLLGLVERHGVRTAAFAEHGLTSKTVAMLRDAVRDGSIRLKVHRLRHRWLLRVVNQDAQVAMIIRDNDLTRDDLITIYPGLVATVSGATVIRSA